MDFNYGTGFGVVSAPRTSASSATRCAGTRRCYRWDAVETAGRFVMPILDRWLDTIDEASRTTAPAARVAAADRLLAMDGREWRDMSLESSTVSTSLDAIRAELARTKLSPRR